MRKSVHRLALVLLCFGMVAGMAQPAKSVPPNSAADSLLKTFLHDFDLPVAAAQADRRLRIHPRDATALFVRMEAAELQERQNVVLDSALRLCRLTAAPELQEIAANRVLQHAANTQAFNAVRRHVAMVATLHNACTFNLRLALVAAANDGAPIDLDQAAHAANLLARWRIAGPFGRYNNVDFELTWPPEADQLSRPQYSIGQATIDQGGGDQGMRDQKTAPELEPTGEKTKGIAGTSSLRTERFWFRDGMVALPEYMSAPGIYYGAADVELAHSQMSRIEVLCSGTYSVFVDGKLALFHDSRHVAQANRASSTLQLTPGHHRVLLKFTADSTPFSISLHPQSDVPAGPSSSLPPFLRQYVLPLSAYFHGDLVGMAQLIESESPVGTTPYLRALLYSAADEHSPRATALWKAVGRAQGTAMMARLKVAESDVERGQADDILRQDVSTLLGERPQSEEALALAFHLSGDHRSRDQQTLDQTDAPALLSRLLEAHPSCTRLVEAIKFYGSIAQQDKARALEQQLSSCAPESLLYARVLSDSGRHGTAAAYLQQIVAHNPWHRSARRNLVEQLVLADRLSAARLQAAHLRLLAPNASGYARLEKDPTLAQDSNSQRANGFTTGEEFYRPYRRDGLELVRKAAQRSFSGGTSVVLLSDKAIELKQDGSVSIYVHRITRPLNKDGISQYGEITIPRGADLLELRTIKRSGEIIEPELPREKPTISMAALEPDDAIEEEFVLHYAEMGRLADDAGSFTFGSFAAPVLYSRLVLLTPSNLRVRTREQSGPPLPLIGQNNGATIRIWERDNIAQTVPEALTPDTNLLATITVMVNEQTLEGLRDELMGATRAGLHVHDNAFALSHSEDQNRDLNESRSETEKAKRIYRFVTGKIESTGTDWADNSAEDTLNNGQGSRTAAFLALARATGLKAALIMARRIELNCGKPRELSCYTEPLVRLWLRNGETIDLDAESDALPFGVVPPWVEVRDALLVAEFVEHNHQPEIVTLVTQPEAEKSVAEADLSLHHGDLVARLHVRLGAARAQEVRSLLRNSSDHNRQAFLEQLAVRIFPGASAITGSINNERDSEQSLELSLNCTVAQYVGHDTGTVDIDQLVPVLGLRAIYARTSERLFPLYLDSLFLESTVFHLRLPIGVEARSLPGDFTSRSEFGEYALRFVKMPGQIDIHRDFRIPIQVIAPERYAAFAQFARMIDEAERQRITLELSKDTLLPSAQGTPITALK